MRKDLRARMCSCPWPQMERADVYSLTSQLRHVRLAFVHTFRIGLTTTMPTDTQPRVLRRALALLSALPCIPRHIHIDGWTATSDVLGGLVELSKSETLSLTLKASPYPGYVEPSAPIFWPLSRVPALIPRTYTKVNLKVQGVYTQDLAGFIDALPGDRTEAQPLRVVVSGKDESWAESMNDRLVCRGTYKHVTVSVEEEAEE